MGLLRSLSMLLLLWFFMLPIVGAQSPGSSTSPARALDALLQNCAYGAFVRHRPRTGVVYDGVVPSNLTGIQVSAMRLRSGSLRTRGVSMYKEFEIPVGVHEQPYVKRLVLVYQNLGDWSMVYYPLSGYMYLAPVLSLLAYDASNLSAKNLPELDIQASRQPILIRFLDVQSVPDGSVPRCVWFDLNGLVNFSNVMLGNTCLTFQQGHFSIVVESTVRSKVGIIVGSVLGGLALFVFLGLLIVWARKYKHRKKMQQMEKAAEVGETLHMTTVGSVRAPAATVTRTQPTLEMEYVP